MYDKKLYQYTGYFLFTINLKVAWKGISRKYRPMAWKWPPLTLNNQEYKSCGKISFTYQDNPWTTVPTTITNHSGINYSNTVLVVDEENWFNKTVLCFFRFETTRLILCSEFSMTYLYLIGFTYSMSSAESQKGVSVHCSPMFRWEPEGRYRHRLCTVDSGLLVLNETFLNNINALLALNQWYIIVLPFIPLIYFFKRGIKFYSQNIEWNFHSIFTPSEVTSVITSFGVNIEWTGRDFTQWVVNIHSTGIRIEWNSLLNEWYLFHSIDGVNYSLDLFREYLPKWMPLTKTLHKQSNEDVDDCVFKVNERINSSMDRYEQNAV